MGNVAGLCVLECPKTGFNELSVFIVVIVPVEVGGPLPAGCAFYPEVVVGISCQRTVAAGGLQDALGEFDACGYTGTLHFFYGNISESTNVLASCVGVLSVGAKAKAQAK